MKISTTLSIVVSGAMILPIMASGALVYTMKDGGLLWNQPIQIDGTAESGGVGGILADPVSGNSSGYTTPFYSLCLDVSGVLYLNTPQSFTSVGFPSSTLLGLNPRWGNDGSDSSAGDATKAGAALNNAAHLFYTVGSLLTAGSSVEKAALQLAVWEVLYDTGSSVGFDLDQGRFQSTGSVKNAAELILAQAFPGNTQAAPGQYSGNLLVAVDGNGHWDPTKQELLLDPTTITPVPEASTLFAGFAGLAMLLTAAWRHHGRAVTAGANVA